MYAGLCPATQEGPHDSSLSLPLPVLLFFLSCPVAQSISSALQLLVLKQSPLNSETGLVTVTK